ncbi:unnamed protein product [Camellia sinensis]
MAVLFWEQRRALAGIKAAGNVLIKCQVRTHPPSDGLHFIVMDANLWPNKGAAPELTLFQIFGSEHEDIPNPVLNFVSMREDFIMQNSQPPYSSCWTSPATAQNQSVQLRDFVPEPVHEIQETRIVDSDLEGQKHTTHDDDQLVAQCLTLLGATSEDLFNTCQLLPRMDLLRNSHGLPIAMILNLRIKMPICSLDGNINNYLCVHRVLLLSQPNPMNTSAEELSWSPEKYVAEFNLPFVPERPAVQTSQLPYSEGFILAFEGYISKPESPNPQLPTSSEEFYCENNTQVAQGLPFPGGNIDNLWNRNKPFPSEKEYFIVEPAEKLTWIGDFGLVVQEPRPGNIFFELELPPVHEDPGLPNLQLPGSGYISILGLPNSQVAQGLPFTGGITPLPSFGDHNNQTFPPPLVETSYTSLDAPLIYNGNSNGADLGLPTKCKRAKLCSKGKDQRRHYNKFSPDETNKLIDGIRRYARTYGCWIKIKNEYFKNDPHRTPDNLKQKWKHMMERDPSLKKLYKRALIANKND